MENKIGEGIYAEFGSMFSLVGCQAIRTKNIKKLTNKLCGVGSCRCR